MSKSLLTYIFALLFYSVASFGTTTQVVPTQCGTTLPTLSTPIYASLVANATAYKFRVELDGQFYEVEKTLRTFKLTDLPVYRFAAIYYIQVAAKVNGVYSDFGVECDITAPSPTTWIIDSMCGTTLTALDQIIYATSVSNATGYRFRIMNTENTNQIYILDRALREFRMSQLDVSSGSSFLVDVAVRNMDGTYLPYGPACVINTPNLTTQLTIEFCGKNLDALSEDLYAVPVSFASRYRFKVTDVLNPANEAAVEKPLATFELSEFPFIKYDNPYLVSVSVRDQAGVWQPYGPNCTVITPTMPIPKIQLSQCDLIASTMNEVIYADAILNATAYRFRLQTSTFSQWIDRPVRSFTLDMFNGLTPGTEYTVRVAVKVGGTYSAYGKACTITTPLQEEINRLTDAPIQQNPSVYPNPFRDSFYLKLPDTTNHLATITICDTTGREVENHSVNLQALDSTAFGATLPEGIYLVRVLTKDNQYSVRVLKK